MGNIKRGYLSGRLRRAIPVFIFTSFLFLPLICQDSLPDINVSIDSKNKTINQILDQITLQTGYHFTYNSELITGRQKVQFMLADIPLEKALDSLFSNPLFAYRAIDRNIVIYQKNQSLAVPISDEIDRSILKGRILDSRSKKPLQYATIALYGTSLGSISNQDGDFSFKIPGNLTDPLLVVSFMGYQRTYFTVNYPLEDEIIILLEREMIPLQEVIIRFADPEMLIREAMNRISENYLDDHATMTAFYRESVKRNDHSMVYSEAVLDVAKTPYTLNTAKDHVKIRKARKITNVSTEDTVVIKLRSGIYTSLSLDVMKNPPDFLSDDFITRYDLEFTDMMTFGDRLVYVISFHQKKHITDLLFLGELYIDHENLTLLAADFEFNPDLIHKEPGLFQVSRSPYIRIRPIKAKYHVDYRELNGKYHISQVRAEVDLKVRKRRRWIGARYSISIEMAITDVLPGQRLRINPTDRVNSNIVLADESFQFDPSFWGIYNVIEPEGSLMESIQRLEQKHLEITN